MPKASGSRFIVQADEQGREAKDRCHPHPKWAALSERDNRVIASASAESSTLDCTAVLVLSYETLAMSTLLIYSEKNGWH
jgi:hypothetical protein